MDILKHLSKIALGVSIISFFVSNLILVIIALGLGIYAYIKCDKSNKAERGYCIAAIVIPIVALVIVLVGLGLIAFMSSGLKS